MALGLAELRDRLAWRETRGAGRHFGYLVACITLGVGALVAVGSFAASLERTVARSARALMGGDVEIRSTQPLSLDGQRHRGRPHPAGNGHAHARPRAGGHGAAGGEEPDRRAQGGGAGLSRSTAHLVTDAGGPLDTLIGGGRALVHDSLLTRLGLRVGDRFRIGEGELHRRAASSARSPTAPSASSRSGRAC